MDKTTTSPALRPFTVWASRGCYQEIDATSAAEAYRIAEENPGDWEPCDDEARLDPDVQDRETDEFIHVGEPSPTEELLAASEVAAKVLGDIVADNVSDHGEVGALERLHEAIAKAR